MIAAAIQMVSGAEIDKNLEQAEQLINEAVRRKADLVVLPENFARISRTDAEHAKFYEKYGVGEIQSFLSKQASSNGIILVAGTLPLYTENAENKVTASCLVYDKQGQVCGRYDKVHLFDVNIPDTADSYRESEMIYPGKDVNVVATDAGNLGLTVCYDLRFPELFRRLSDLNAEIFTVPAAFTDITGQAHWEVLLRARAIENLAYVIAADQAGLHENGRITYGNSMIIDPWGKILTRLHKGPGVITENISLKDLKKVRDSFPVLDHKRI